MTIRSALHPRRPAGLLLAAMLLSGCSALRVDVDVYKGPLSSQREVQVRQFATLAIAAKPLLAELRNLYEKEEGGFDVTSAVGRSEQWSYADHPFKNEVARFANGALSYYDDLPPPTNLVGLEPVRAAEKEFQVALKVFNVSPSDCGLAAQIKIQDDVAKAVVHFLRAGSLTDTSQLSELCGTGRESFSYVTSSAALGLRRIEQIAEELCIEIKPPRMCKKSAVSDMYLQLAQHGGGLSREIAARVAKDDVSLQAALEARLREIGLSFKKARVKMLELRTLSTQMLREAYRRLPRSNAQIAAQFVSNVTEPRILACFFAAMPYVEGEQPEVREGILRDVPKDWSQSEDRQMRSRRFTAAAQALEGVAHLYPTATAKTLDLVHDRLLALDEKGLTLLSTCPHYSAATDSGAELRFAAKHFGLARGTAVQNEFDRVLTAIVTQLTTLDTSTQFGFGDGRTRTGIVTLTRNYVEALDMQAGIRSNAAVVESRRRLEEMLITFAERVLYIANNTHLLGSQVQNAEMARNTALLQAMGNTLIVLADDLRRQDDHVALQSSRRRAEATAINRAFAGRADATYDALIVEITSTARRLQEEAGRLEAHKGQLAVGVAPVQEQLGKVKLLITKAEESVRKIDGESTTAREDAALFRGASWLFAAAPAPSNEPPSAAADRKALASTVDKLPAQTAGSAVVEAIKAWVAAAIAIDKPGGRDARIMWLEDVQIFFARPDVTFPGLEDGNPKKAFNEIHGRITSWAARRASMSAKANVDLQGARADLAKLQNNQKSLEGTAKVAAAKIEPVDQRLGQVKISTTELEAALETIKDLKKVVLPKATGPDAADPVGLKQILESEIQQLSKAAAVGSDEANRYALALAYVKRTSPAAAVAVESNVEPGTAGTSRQGQVEVLDDLIAQLRHRHLQALSSGDAGRAKNYEEALKAAYDQRGGMAYLRPASAYLRNVYSATGILDDPKVGFENLLLAQAKRLVEAPSELAKAQAAVEKQFWQNINSVRVEAGGASNYVLVKDDVGNWYLKAVSSDTSSIIKSAQSLALFNMGRKFDVNLLRRTELSRRIDDRQATGEERQAAQAELAEMKRDPGANTAAATSGLTSLQQRYASEYAKQTGTDVDSLLAVIERVRDDLVANWKQGLTESGADAMQAPLAAMVSAEMAEQASARQRLEAVADAAGADRPAAGANAIIDALRSMRRLRDRLSREILSADGLVQTARDEFASAGSDLATLDKANTAKTDTAYKNAEEAVASKEALFKAAEKNRARAARGAFDVINQLIAATTSRRLDAVKTAETAYQFIGEAATAK